MAAPAPAHRLPLLKVLRWLVAGIAPDPGFDAHVPADFAYPNPRTPLDIARPHATWIGHDSFVLQLAGLRILTDPIFGDYAAPVPWPAMRRLRPAGLALAQLGPVDAVLLSHNHYDHLEAATVRALGERAHWFVPLGLKAWFARRGVQRVTELDWWQTVEFADRVQLTFTPAQHFSARGLFDRNRSLWGGWAVQGAARRVYFAGDTGYHERIFRDIGARLGPPDLALLPIGSYEPRSFMQSMHADPADAVQIHRDLGSRLSVGMHWGSFRLSAEPPQHPPWRLFQALQAAGEAPEKFRVLEHGQALNF